MPRIGDEDDAMREDKQYRRDDKKAILPEL